MSLKNNLRIGQASLEYFIIFAVIAGLTLISAGTFLPQVRDAAEGLFKKAAGRIVNAGSNSVNSPAPTPNSPPVPPNAQPLTWNKRYEPGLAAGGELVYVAKLDADNWTRLFFFLQPTNEGEADATYTLTLPDGREFNGTALNSSVGGGMTLITKNYEFPNFSNIDYDYLPRGNYLIRMRANNKSAFVMRLSGG